MSNRLKRFLRSALIALGVLALYVAWVYFQPDDDLSPELQAALAQRAKSLPDDQTAAVALLGLEAPAGEDFMAYGRKVLAAQRAGMDWMAAAKLANNGKSALTINYRADLECWFYSKGEVMDDRVRGNCASGEKVAAYLKEDAEMIARYRIAQKLPRPSGNVQFRGQTAIQLSKMNAVEVAYDVQRGKPEEAYGKWRNHYIHQTRMAGNGSAWVLTAINLVDESLSLSALEILLDRAPQFMAAHGEEFLELFKPGDLYRYDIPAIILGENEWMGLNLGVVAPTQWLRVNRLRNRQFERAQKVIQLAQKPMSEFAVRQSELQANESALKALRVADLLDPTSAAAWIRIKDGDRKAAALIDSMIGMEARRRLLALKLNLVNAKIADGEITAYLEKAPPMLRNPWDEAPARWDPARRIIAMKHPARDWSKEVHL